MNRWTESTLTVAGILDYSHGRGIYPEQVKEWKEICMNANDNAREKNSKAGKELQEERKARRK